MKAPSLKKITRRDFIGGIAIGTAGTLLSPAEALARMSSIDSRPHLTGTTYPPGLTGMRGDHVGSFETAHDLARLGKRFTTPARDTGETYDLVVVGGGLSGLSAAYFFQNKVGPEARILIIDNHDDFGGHAKRNEFTVDGKTLIGHGGSQTMESPGNYSKVAKALLKGLAIEVDKFYTYFDRKFGRKHKLERSIYFNSSAYGPDMLLPDPFASAYSANSNRPAAGVIGNFPVDDETRSTLTSLVVDETDYLAGKSVEEKISILRKISYEDFLLTHAGMTEAGAILLREKLIGFWGIAWDSLSALEGCRLEMPGTEALDIPWRLIDDGSGDEPYIHHFPDGNAGVARALVRRLLPHTMSGSNMEDLVTSDVDYGRLDEEGASVRIRLSSTGIDVRHVNEGKEVDLTYIQHGSAHRVRAKHVVMACNNRIIPHLCSEVPARQAEAIAINTRTPLAYVNVALRNWKSFAELGTMAFFIPQASLTQTFYLDFPVSMGDYEFSKGPDEPIIVHGTYVPNVPGQGLTARQQFPIGRQKLYELEFGTFEEDVVSTFEGALGGGGFDAERDIAGITVNRWPHGYSYEYNELIDPPEWNRKNGPHILGRAQIGRISIANSDSEAYAYVDGAIDAAHRAIEEQIALR